MTIQQLRVDQIRCGPRQRQVAAGKVADIARSIAQQGLLQAIGVRPLQDDSEQFEVVFGAHRLAAMVLLEQETIAAYVLPPDLVEEEYLLMELQENSARHDLTSAQRKAYVAETARLLARLSDDAHLPNGQKNWLMDLSKKTGRPFNTLRNWWSSFCQDSGLAMTPGEAKETNKQHFYDWLDEQKRKEDEAKQQQADERKRQIQHEECESGVNHLANLAQMYGVEVVETQVIAVFKERFVRHSHA